MTVALKTAPAAASHIKPTQLVSGTFVTTDLKRIRRMCEELLGLECALPEPGVLLIREQGHQDFGLGRVQKPRFRHGSYAFYFVDGDSNWWEIEYRTPELLYTALREKGDQH